MPNLNSPVQPMMAGRDTGGVVKKIVVVLVVLAVAAGGYYLYQSGKIPFLKKASAPPATEVGFPPEQTMEQPPQQQVPQVQTPSAAPPPATTAPAPVTKTSVAAPPQAAPGPGEYTVVIASFVEKKLADEESARWSNAGIPSTVSEKMSGGRTWYRVSVGRYETRKLAVKAAKEMEHMFESGYWVEKMQ